MKKDLQTVDEYIGTFPKPVQEQLKELRKMIADLVPGAEERISYQMPSFYLNGSLVYYAGYAKHIGFYPTSSGIESFKSELAKYKFSKGAVQFPLGEPLPTGLIKKIVKFRVKENLKKKKQ